MHGGPSIQVNGSDGRSSWTADQALRRLELQPGCDRGEEVRVGNQARRSRGTGGYQTGSDTFPRDKYWGQPVDSGRIARWAWGEDNSKCAGESVDVPPG